jgi:mono/diheme cytochrome c family protein
MKLKIILPLLALATVLFAAETNNLNSAKPAADAQIQRGKYLVENVAMCAECHTPKTDKGDYDRTQWLQGDVLDIKPVRLMPFAAAAPPIAGMPGFTDEQALKFLETGIDLTGKPAMPPMPQYRFSHDDALAVLAYLRSLKR